MNDKRAHALAWLAKAGSDSLDLSELTPYAVETRYDAEFWPDRATAESAVGSADELLELISGFLAQP